MNLIFRLSVIGLLVTATPAFGATDQVRPTERPDPQLGAPAPNQSIIPTSPKRPFARVFRASDLTEQEKLRAKLLAELRRADTQHTEVICGLTVRYVDERSDPRIIMPRRDEDVDAKIRRIAPQVCRRAP